MFPSKDKTEFTVQIYAQFARIGKALGNPKRLQIVDLLAQAEQNVDDLARKTRLSVASVSQHLQVLRAANIVIPRREGNHIYYRLSSDQVLEVWDAMRNLANSSLLEIEYLVRSYGEDKQKLEAIDTDELRRRLEDDTITILDVRPEDEYRAAHIPSAVSIPLNELMRRLAELPKDKEIVAYCRATYCLLSDEAAQILAEAGFKVRVFRDGMPAWRMQGHPVESTLEEDECEESEPDAI